VDRAIAWSFQRLINFGDALEYWGTQARSLFLDLMIRRLAFPACENHLERPWELAVLRKVVV
jgi:hypothetical protein